jgi:hypothetical protein
MAEKMRDRRDKKKGKGGKDKGEGRLEGEERVRRRGGLGRDEEQMRKGRYV